MSRVKKLVNNNYVFSVFTKIFLILIGVVISAIQVRFLGKELNGKLSYINSSCTILNTLLVFGVHQAYTYYRKKYGATFKEYYLGSIGIIFAVYLMVSILINTVMSLSVEDSIIVAILPLFFLTKIIRYVTLVEHPKEKNKVEIMVNIVQVVFICGLFIFGHVSYFWLAILAIFHELLCCIFYICKLRVKIKVCKDSLTLLFKLLTFGFFPMLGLLLNDINYKVDVLMLKSSTTYASVSIYTVGIGLAEKCWAIPDAIRDILLSKLACGEKKNEVAKIIRFSNTITIMIQVALVIVGKFVISILYGAEYEESYYVLLIAMLGTYGMIYTKMINVYNLVEGRKVINTIFMFLVAMSNIIINTFLIPIWGIYGAGIASVISYNLCGLLFVIDFKKRTGVQVKDMMIITKEDVMDVKGMLGHSK